MHRRFLAVAALSAVLAALSVPAPAAAATTGCTRSGDYTVCRTDPRGGEDTSIVAEIVRQIGKAKKGDTVRAAAFELTLHRTVAPLTEALADAEGRGVDVRVVVGERSGGADSSGPAIAELEQAGAKVEQCAGSCLPTASGEGRGPHHNRFFLIERGGTPTVLVTSFNFRRGHAEQAHLMIGVHGDRELFEFYSGFWNRLYGGGWDGWGERDKTVATDLAQAWVFPRKEDPIAEQLGRITGCGDGDRVLVAHANFQSNRPAVRGELDRIQGLGCQVRVLLTDKDTNDPGWLKDKLGKSNVRIHPAYRSKLIIAEAQFGDRHESVVWTGTHNLTANSLNQTDDNVLKVEDGEVVDLLAAYFQRLWREA
ncbi:phospholipase D-like domain-containing protein [Glycomyces sp. A-F 0318]|uniref:phospholipase D-like domain-containing protein n=1 Tax=Glycomyces amatae TaxID=2881355 RepID=UPI001E2B6455|nr:phospholipase D-like domain-containing protein [Glycomyces amatae]MCD0445186.1 phospholipase D-like domain-containing protein [Glycomyces amatae]